jgi:hypothetical protein
MQTNPPSCAVFSLVPLAWNHSKQDYGHALWKPVCPPSSPPLERGDKVENYSLSKGILYCRSSKGQRLKLVVPATATPMVFAYFHDSPLGGHLGVLKTINKICSQFIWKGVDKDIRSQVCACHTCALSKPAQNSRLGLLASEAAETDEDLHWLCRETSV